MDVTLWQNAICPWPSADRDIKSASAISVHQLLSFTFTTLWANSADDKVMIFFPENRHGHFMQIVSYGDNLHEMSKLIFWEK